MREVSLSSFVNKDLCGSVCESQVVPVAESEAGNISSLESRVLWPRKRLSPVAEEGWAQVPVSVHSAGAALPFLGSALGDKGSTRVRRLPPHPKVRLNSEKGEVLAKGPTGAGVGCPVLPTPSH